MPVSQARAILGEPSQEYDRTVWRRLAAAAPKIELKDGDTPLSWTSKEGLLALVVHDGLVSDGYFTPRGATKTDQVLWLRKP
jgi:hypothetical protein